MAWFCLRLQALGLGTVQFLPVPHTRLIGLDPSTFHNSDFVLLGLPVGTKLDTFRVANNLAIKQHKVVGRVREQSKILD